MADLNLGIDWTDGQPDAQNPFTGGARNFRGVASDGATLTIDGELQVDPSFGVALRRVETGEINLPGLPSVPSQQTGSMMVTLSGDLTSEGESMRGELLLGGVFFGTGGQAVQGSVSGGLRDTATPSGQVFDAGAGGTFYIERQ